MAPRALARLLHGSQLSGRQLTIKGIHYLRFESIRHLLRALGSTKIHRSSDQVLLASSLFLLVFTNLAFFRHLLQVYPPILKNLVNLGSVVVVLFAMNTLILAFFCSRYTLKWVLIPVLMLSSLTAYFMDSFGAIIDVSMLVNVLQTDSSEVRDLIHWKLLAYVTVLGVLPSIAIYRIPLRAQSLRQAFWRRIGLIFGSVLLIGLTVVLRADFFASFFRVQKQIRYYANPVCYMYAVGKLVRDTLESPTGPVQPIGQDAHVASGFGHQELIIMIVGETARADRFSLNGYDRPTNPWLEGDQVISFTNFWSCGTSTAVSVPCMFSVLGEEAFSRRRAESTENALDLLAHSGTNLAWIDNNSDSKGVADRVPYLSVRGEQEFEAGEIRDEAMLAQARTYIEDHPQGDIFIVLHQMGNHGPAYYKRYPKEFEVFEPVCKTSQLNDCSQEEISNAYDNAIVYTDYFLHQVIELLREYDGPYETAMLYVSDHGESLGEGGLYLHGLPNFVAPDAQRHVPVIMWIGQFNDDINREAMSDLRHAKFSHDNVFHTILGLLEVESVEYDPDLDLVRRSQRSQMATLQGPSAL